LLAVNELLWVSLKFIVSLFTSIRVFIHLKTVFIFMPSAL
jgi:hypothetical protein